MIRVEIPGSEFLEREGCSRKAIEAPQILVKSPIDAIDLLLSAKRLIATLRV